MLKNISEVKFGLVAAMLVVAFAAALVMAAAGCSPNGGIVSSDYNLIKADAKVVRIGEEVNVRAQPILEENLDGIVNTTNSFGRTKVPNFTLEVAKVYRTDASPDKQNGEYIGLSVDDILAAPEGGWFPEGIKDDPDGIVWINHDYIDVLA